MKICILGWYGTETIGDRAILAGIISLLNNRIDNIQIFLGSLYPFYSQRMLKEDQNLYECLTQKKIDISLFDSRDKKTLDKFINESEVILMGGGPIMNIEPLKMIQYAFKKAKELNKKTMVFGCGIGPIFNGEYTKYTLDILNNSDTIVLRDSASKQYFRNLITDLKIDFDFNKILISFDPAVECAMAYLKIREQLPQNKDQAELDIVINFRDFPNEYSQNNDKEIINKNINKFLKVISEHFQQDKILLIPMHYFYIGNDDREFLNKLVITNSKMLKNVNVQNIPLSLVQTMECFFNAKMAIGMRFHSVVLQTILNGNNYILDYTEPQRGKIYGFIKDIDYTGFYDTRYINLQNKTCIQFEEYSKSIHNKFTFDNKYFLEKRQIYLDAIDLIL